MARHRVRRHSRLHGIQLCGTRAKPDPARTSRETYQEIGSRISRRCTDGAYLGVENPGQIERLSEGEIKAIYGPTVDAVFSTQELAIDPDPLADLIVKRVADSETITLYTDTTVTKVDPTERRIDVGSPEGDSTRLGPYDHVINCAWEGRPVIDSTVGLHQPAPWSYRMKYFLKAMTGLFLPSTTIVLGPFGDIVQYATGGQYLAWYPSGLRGWSTAIAPPRWPTRPLAKEASSIARETLAHLSEVVPAVTGVPLDTVDVRGGVIYALGQTDVDDPASQLHKRSDVGTTTLHGWYHSIDTGKYTTAPLFAKETADRVTETG